MADFDSSLPIFSRSTSNPVIISKDTSANAVANPIYTQLSDGTDLATIDGSGNLNVNVAAGSLNIASDYAEDSVHTTGDTGSFVLSVRSDTAASTAGTDGDYAGLISNATGHLWTEDKNSASILTSLQILDDWDESDRAKVNLIVGQAGIAGGTGTDGANVPRVSLATDIPLPTGTNSIGAVTQATHDSFNANANIQVGDADVSNSNAVPVSRTTSANSETNPIFVQQVEGAVSGVEVHDYNTATVTGSGGTNNHDYVVTADSTLLLQQVIGSASGAGKWELQTVSTVGPTTTTIAVGFTSMAFPNIDWKFAKPVEAADPAAADTMTVRLIRTNRELSNMDMYSTFVGAEI